MYINASTKDSYMIGRG